MPHSNLEEYVKMKRIIISIEGVSVIIYKFKIKDNYFNAMYDTDVWKESAWNVIHDALQKGTKLSLYIKIIRFINNSYYLIKNI